MKSRLNSSPFENYPVTTRYSVDHWLSEHCRDTLDDNVAAEVPIAICYCGISHVVMMMTPADLENFAIGFSISEGIIQASQDIRDIIITKQPNGIELDIQISSRQFSQLKHKRRNMIGQSGCGICGVESLDSINRPIEKITSDQNRPNYKAILTASNLLSEQQKMKRLSGAHHAAAWCNLNGTVQLVREDIGRHNALDKVIGALFQKQIDISKGFLLVSSRASYEMVLKAAVTKIPSMVSISAATDLAITTAKEANLSLAGFIRDGRIVAYHWPGSSTL